MLNEIIVLEVESLAASQVSLILILVTLTCAGFISKNPCAFLKAISFEKSIKGFLDKVPSFVSDSSTCCSYWKSFSQLNSSMETPKRRIPIFK